MNPIEYKARYKHTTNIVSYSLLFSSKQMKFIKPVLTERGVAANLVYRLLPGHYLRFYAYIWRSEVIFKLIIVDIDESGNVDESEVINEKFDYEYLEKIMNDANAPRPLVDFFKMAPHYHGAPHVNDSVKYENYKSAMEVTRKIRDYLESLLVSEASE